MFGLFLNKYVASSTKSNSKQRTPSLSSKSKSKHRCSYSSHKRYNDHRQKKRSSHPKASITSSCDTFCTLSETSKSTATITNNEAPEEISSNLSESISIVIETKKREKDSKKAMAINMSKSKHYCKHIKYWTISIASKHDYGVTMDKSDTEDVSNMIMGFGVFDVSDADNPNYHHSKYEYYQTRLKSLDDILISFNTHSNKLTLWQNGKRFNRTFEFNHSKIYSFVIKICDHYSIKLLANTFNLF